MRHFSIIEIGMYASFIAFLVTLMAAIYFLAQGNYKFFFSDLELSLLNLFMLLVQIYKL